MSDIKVINLWPIESNCGACGVRLVNAKHGIPVYEDLVLPNDWDGEWGGKDACPECYAVQQTLVAPVTTAWLAAKAKSEAPSVSAGDLHRAAARALAEGGGDPSQKL